MRSSIPPFLAAFILVSTALPAAFDAQTLSLWEDPDFQRSFLGSYGFQAEIEPRVTTVEREIMEKILPLMDVPDKAIRALRKETKPASSAVFDFTLGNLHFQQEKLTEAAAHYRTAIEKFPSFRRAHKNLGILAVRQGSWEEGIRHLSRVLELGGGDGLVYGLLGYAYSTREAYLPAETAYRQAMLLQPEILDWKLGLTQALFKQRRYREALALSDQLLAEDPERTDFLLLQANAWIGLDEPRKAAQVYELVDRMGGSTPQSLRTLGDIYVNEEMYDLALRSYRRGLDGTDDPSLPLRQAEILARRGALDQAAGLVAQIQARWGDSLEGDDRKSLLKLRSRIAVAEGKGGEAVEVLEEIVQIDPLDGDALLLLGQHYEREGDPDRAVFYYERAESLQDHEAEAKVRHAQVLVEQGKYQEALPLLKRAQEVDPREDVARYLDQVERASRSRR